VFEEDGAAEDVDFASEASASFLVECEVWKGMVGKVEGEARNGRDRKEKGREGDIQIPRPMKEKRKLA
jgi:hypothetical protein